MIKKENIKLVTHSWLIICLGITLVASYFAVIGLRDNYSKMVELREQVVIADQKNADVEVALQNLRSHVYSHMNTDLTSGSNPIKPPIQLKARYERLMKKEEARVKRLNSEVTAQGEAICGQRFPAGGYNAPRVACVQDYVSQNGIGASPVPEDLYKFDFVSPSWSPDLAGYSILIAIMSGVIFAVGLATKIIKRRHF